MRKIKLFEEFSANEGMMSNIDLIGKDSETKEVFMRDVKDFLKKHAANPAVADDNNYLEELSNTYFREDGSKIEIED
jgi:hypothetical protein